jgi:hypothetical protein
MTHAKDEALKLALDALTRYVNEDDICEGMPGNEPWVETKYMGEAAITAIKQTLAAPVQEPVWIQPDHLQKAQKAPFLCRVEPHKRDDFVPLYTTPPAQPAPDYAWPTVADYEKDVGFKVNEAFKMAWTMARTTNALFT